MTAPLRLAHTTPPRWPAIKPDRFAARVRSDVPEGCALALIGLPDDTGVKLNGGRPGAALGPAAFRTALAGFGTDWDGRDGRRLNARVFDAGDVEPARAGDEQALEETHARVQRAVAELHGLGLLPICIGGGHDLSLPAITALARHAGGAVGGISLDAHLDTRERVGSGMAFRRLIDAGSVAPRWFAEIGLGRFVNDEADLRWLTDKGATLVSAEAVLGGEMPFNRLFGIALAHAPAAFVSVDLDGLDATVAPGVSAPNPMGLLTRHAATLCEAAGAAAGVRHFDIMELSPPHDDAGRTARVAAFLMLSFLAGFEARPK
jgi:formimidoylglutamase